MTILLLYLVFFKAASLANPGTYRNSAGASSYISRHIFLKFLNTLANTNVSLNLTLNYCNLLIFLFQNLYKFFLRAPNLHQ